MAFRAKFIKKINKVTNDEEKSKVIEKNIFDWCLSYSEKTNIQPTNFKNIIFKKLYMSKVKQVCYNITNYLGKKITLDNVHKKTYKEIYPTKWKKFSKDLEILNTNISDLNLEVATTDQFQCPKCKQRKCTYVQVQLRSSDEPMTNMVNCLTDGCYHNFRC